MWSTCCNLSKICTLLTLCNWSAQDVQPIFSLAQDQNVPIGESDLHPMFWPCTCSSSNKPRVETWQLARSSLWPALHKTQTRGFTPDPKLRNSRFECGFQFYPCVLRASRPANQGEASKLGPASGNLQFCRTRIFGQGALDRQEPYTAETWTVESPCHARKNPPLGSGLTLSVPIRAFGENAKILIFPL
jgi:hypothetical protein